MISHIPAGNAPALLAETGEFALLDVREAGPFSEGHPLFAVPCPFSCLEQRVLDLVPRLDVPVMLIDEGDGVADCAATAMSRLGYNDLHVIAGGLLAWRAAGHSVYQGVNVPSKVLGELVEACLHPPTLQPETLAKWRAEGHDLLIFDCRAPHEYAKFTIPGAVCLPNGELPHRLPAIQIREPIVLTCAGRTRGLIGAASLRLLLPEAQVYALENGTQGWALAGLELSRGNDPRPFPRLTPDQREVTRQRARALMDSAGVPLAPPDQVARFSEDPERTTFLLDVRAAEEAEADPLPAFRHALSGQLVQATDAYVGVRRARLVLADDVGLRAAVAALWLRAMGFDAQVALVDDHLRALALPPRPELRQPPAVSPAAALTAVRDGRAQFVDLRSSAEYRAGHVAGAVWATRGDLRRLLHAAQKQLLLISGNDGRAAFAAHDIAGRGNASWVEGGIEALRRTGAVIEAGGLLNLRDRPDVTWFAHGRHDGDLAASRTYLAWETGLLDQLSADERREFKIGSLNPTDANC